MSSRVCRALRRFWLARDGATAVEFALTAPIFFALLAGVFVFGIRFWHQAGMEAGAQAAARCASIGKAGCITDQDIKAFAARNAMGISNTGIVYTVTRGNACGIKVSGTLTFSSVLAQYNLNAATIRAESCYPVRT